MTGQLKDFLLKRQVRWNLPPSGEWKFLLHNNYQPHYSGMNLLWFCQGERFPRVVTKLCRDHDLLRREYENLCVLEAAIRDFNPRPLHFGEFSGFWMLWMSGVPGQRFKERPEYSLHALQSITKTIISIHAATQRRQVPTLSRFDEMVSQPMQALCNFGSSMPIRKGCEMLRETISEAWIASLPMIPQHGDLYIGNLLSGNKCWYVVDWESFGIIDLPLYDLLTFCFSLLHVGTRSPDAWNRTLTRIIPFLIADYARSFGLSKRDVKLLLPLTLLNWFHLQWKDGRQEFSKRMYTVIEGYFENSTAWENLLDLADGGRMSSKPSTTVTIGNAGFMRQ